MPLCNFFPCCIILLKCNKKVYNAISLKFCSRSFNNAIIIIGIEGEKIFSLFKILATATRVEVERDKEIQVLEYYKSFTLEGMRCGLAQVLHDE